MARQSLSRGSTATLPVFSGLALLEKGYTLRGTSRRIASSEPLFKGPYAPYADRVKIYEVPDMTIDGAFDEASKG
jgi:hypothetical protein